MRTATAPTRRRVTRGPDCDDRPRLWGDEPAAAATIAPERPVGPVAATTAAHRPVAGTAAAPAAGLPRPALAPAGAPSGPALGATVAPVAAPERSTVAPIGMPAGLTAPSPIAPVRTLEDLIAGTWDELTAGEPASCPVCAAVMAPRWSAGAGAVGGRCGDCGTTLE